MTFGGVSLSISNLSQKPLLMAPLGPPLLEDDFFTVMVLNHADSMVEETRLMWPAPPPVRQRPALYIESLTTVCVLTSLTPYRPIGFLVSNRNRHHPRQ